MARGPRGARPPAHRRVVAARPRRRPGLRRPGGGARRLGARSQIAGPRHRDHPRRRPPAGLLPGGLGRRRRGGGGDPPGRGARRRRPRRGALPRHRGRPAHRTPGAGPRAGPGRAHRLEPGRLRPHGAAAAVPDPRRALQPGPLHRRVVVPGGRRLGRQPRRRVRAPGPRRHAPGAGHPAALRGQPPAHGGPRPPRPRQDLRGRRGRLHARPDPGRLPRRPRRLRRVLPRGLAAGARHPAAPGPRAPQPAAGLPHRPAPGARLGLGGGLRLPLPDRPAAAPHGGAHHRRRPGEPGGLAGGPGHGQPRGALPARLRLRLQEPVPLDHPHLQHRSPDPPGGARLQPRGRRMGARRTVPG